MFVWVGKEAGYDEAIQIDGTIYNLTENLEQMLQIYIKFSTWEAPWSSG